MDKEAFKKISRIILVLAAICLLVFIGSFVLKSIFGFLMLIIKLILGAITVGILYLAWLILFKNKKK